MFKQAANSIRKLIGAWVETHAYICVHSDNLAEIIQHWQEEECATCLTNCMCVCAYWVALFLLHTHNRLLDRRGDSPSIQPLGGLNINVSICAVYEKKNLFIGGSNFRQHILFCWFLFGKARNGDNFSSDISLFETES